MMKIIKKIALLGCIAALLWGLTGCFVKPDPTLTPIDISDPSVPFGTSRALPTPTPAPSAPAATATPDNWQNSDQSTWEDWSGNLPTVTPRVASTVAPDAESYQTSTQDYNAGYPVLKLGSTGQDVFDLQTRLAELRYYEGQIDGKYSTETQTAVREFQEKNGLAADGIAGRSTQDLVYSTRAVPKLVSAAANDEGYLLLKEGVSGLEVRKLQARLADLGYYAGGVDGIYGSTTVAAVKAFQRANGLSPDGHAGTQTQNRLYSANAAYATNPVTTADPDSSRTLTVGMTGNDVYALQERLIELRYLNGVPDGVFGEETRQAVIAYQKASGMTADGVVGATTLRKLNSSSKAGNVTSTQQTAGTLREGDSGEPVYELQLMLFELGYYTGRIDGRFGSETTTAVRAFQEANGLTADGIAGRGTQSRLAAGAVAKSAETTAVTEKENTQLSTLRKGDSNDQVRVLQQYLKDLGYLSSEPDGQFGSGTERAVKLFQEANGLTADGIAGRGTLSILYSGTGVTYRQYFGGSSNSAAVTPQVTSTPKPNTDVVIQWQSEGTDVLNYQVRLAELGYLSSRYVTGSFNQQTVEATKAFQTMNGLKVDGAAGPQSLKLIYSNDALDANGVRAGDKISQEGAQSSLLLKSGMTGSEVTALQKQLADMDYLPASFITGNYDLFTENAVKEFQSRNNLTADGVAGASTLAAMSASPVSAVLSTIRTNNTSRQNAEMAGSGALLANISGGGIVVSEGNNLYYASASRGGQLTRQEESSGISMPLSTDVPRFLHLRDGVLWYATESAVVHVNIQGKERAVFLKKNGILRMVMLGDAVYLLGSDGKVEEYTLTGTHVIVAEGVRDLTADVSEETLLMATDSGILSFGVRTGIKQTVCGGTADQVLCFGDFLVARCNGDIVRIRNNRAETIRKDGAGLIAAGGEWIFEVTPSGVYAFDINGQNFYQVSADVPSALSFANATLYMGGLQGYTRTASVR